MVTISSQNNSINLHTPKLGKQERVSLINAYNSGWLSNSGEYVKKFENEISKINKSKYVLSTINGTAALNISLKLINIDYGDEVIVPTVTFIAPINCVLYHGGTPLFMDCDEYLNIDSKKIINFLEN